MPTAIGWLIHQYYYLFSRDADNAPYREQPSRTKANVMWYEFHSDNFDNEINNLDD